MICIVLDLEWRSAFTSETNLLTNKMSFCENLTFTQELAVLSATRVKQVLKSTQVKKKNLFDK